MGNKILKQENGTYRLTTTSLMQKDNNKAYKYVEGTYTNLVIDNPYGTNIPMTMNIRPQLRTFTDEAPYFDFEMKYVSYNHHTGNDEVQRLMFSLDPEALAIMADAMEKARTFTLVTEEGSSAKELNRVSVDTTVVPLNGNTVIEQIEEAAGV